MFVLDARSARIEITDHDALRSIVRRLHGSGHRGLTESVLRAVEDAAGLDDGALDAGWLAPQPHSSPRQLLPEALFGADSLFVLAPAGKRLDAWEIRERHTPSELDAFCEAVSVAADGAGIIDGDEADEPAWRPRSVRPRLGGDRSEDEREGRGVQADADRRAIARVLADDDARGFITELVASGSTITDLDAPMGQYGSMGQLYRSGLIDREHVIICRKDHRTLGRVGDMDDGTRRSILQLSCPTCGRRFDEELLRQVHAPTRAAVDLVTHGRWRISWALSMLEGRGLDEHVTAQLPGSAGNGSALRIETLAGRLLVELPNAEFGHQHAYSLVNRLQHHGIEFGLVLSTEPVTDEARQYLSDRAALSQGPVVVVLEGSDAVTTELSHALDEWSIVSIRLLADELIDATGVDIGSVIEAWMRRRGQTADAAAPADEPGEHEASQPHGTVTRLAGVSHGQ